MAAPREYLEGGSNTFSALTRRAWSDLLHKQVQDKLYFHRKGFIGPDQGEEDALDSPVAWYPILQKTELGKDGGDRITMPLLRQLVAPATTGNTTLKDQTADASTAGEEAMDWWTFDTYIELIRHATGWVHKMSAQRNKFHTKEQAASLLADWLAQQMDDSIFNSFYNRYSAHIITEISGASTTTHPNFIYGGDADSEDAVDAADVLNAAVLERIAVYVEENNFNPIRLSGGEEGFVLIVHPRQLHTLRADQRWIDANQHAGHRDMDNPIFSGSEGMWAGIYIHSTNKVASPGAGVVENTAKRRAVLMGAHSIARAIGQRPQIIKRDDTDYGRINNWAIDVIFGDSRADWTSDDGNSTVSNQSSAIVTTYAPDVNA